MLRKTFFAALLVAALGFAVTTACAGELEGKPVWPKGSGPDGRWVFLLESHEKYFFLDTRSATKRWWTIEAWIVLVTKENYNDPDPQNLAHDQTLFRFNTWKNKYASLQWASYDKTGNPFGNGSAEEKNIEWERIIPGTISERLFEKLTQYFKTR